MTQTSARLLGAASLSSAASAVPARPISITFVMEQHLGHLTFADNLRGSLCDEPHVHTDWVPISYAATSKWWERIPSEAIRSALRGRNEVVRGLRQHGDATAYVFNSQVPAVLGGRASRRRPFVVCMDDTPVLKDSMADDYGHHPDGRVLGAVKHRWNRRLLHAAAGIAPWSNWVRTSLIEDYGISPQKILVIPPGVDVASWKTSTPSTERVLRILFVGGDFERKGGPLLLEAVRSLDPGTVQLDIVTRSDVAAEPGVDVHRGLSHGDDKLRDLFVRSDVFVLVSSSEMFGIAAVEAAAAGLPCIVTRVGGLADLVVEGETGYAIDVGDAAGLTDRLRRLRDDPDLRLRMGAA
ncbi:MAG: glycosyltransferase family 4 protein, partial [Ilumatobacter sp.]